MKKITTLNKVKQHTDGNLYYVARIIINFKQSEFGFKVEYQEYIYDLITDEFGDEKEDIIADYGVDKELFLNNDVNYLFNIIGEDILHTESFTDRFNKLQLSAFLYVTSNQDTTGRYGTKDWLIQ